MSEQWLLIDLARAGKVRLAIGGPGRPGFDFVRQFDAKQLVTFTDALLLFERETGQSLRNQNAIIAIAGAAVGDAISVARTGWTISRSGLSSMLGRDVIIVNEVAAQAWAALDAPMEIFAMKGMGHPRFGPRSRHLFITVDEGVGAAVIDIDRDERITV